MFLQNNLKFQDLKLKIKHLKNAWNSNRKSKNEWDHSPDWFKTTNHRHSRKRKLLVPPLTSNWTLIRHRNKQKPTRSGSEFSSGLREICSSSCLLCLQDFLSPKRERYFFFVYTKQNDDDDCWQKNKDFYSMIRLITVTFSPSLTEEEKRKRER